MLLACCLAPLPKSQGRESLVVSCYSAPNLRTSPPNRSMPDDVMIGNYNLVSTLSTIEYRKAEKRKKGEHFDHSGKN